MRIGFVWLGIIIVFSAIACTKGRAPIPISPQSASLISSPSGCFTLKPEPGYDSEQVGDFVLGGPYYFVKADTSVPDDRYPDRYALYFSEPLGYKPMKALVVPNWSVDSSTGTVRWSHTASGLGGNMLIFVPKNSVWSGYVVNWGDVEPHHRDLGRVKAYRIPCDTIMTDSSMTPRKIWILDR